MLSDAKAQTFDVLLVSAIDRLNRNLHHFLDTFEQLKNWGVSLVSITQLIDTTSDTGDFTIKLLSLLSELERKTIRARTKSGRVASFRAGKSFPGRVPYGYLWDKDNKIIDIDTERAEIYQKIVDMYLNDHLSTTFVADELKKMGIETPGSRYNKENKTIEWTDTMVGRILHNTAYYGKATHLQKGYETDFSKKTGRPYNRKVNKPNDSDPITFTFPKLIFKERWDDIQKRIAYNKSKPKKARKKDAVNKFLTSNTLGKHFICGLCGSVIRAKVYYNKRNGKTMYQYGCTRHLMSKRQLETRNKEKCPLPAINADGFDFEVWFEVINILANPMKFLREWFQSDSQKRIEKDIKQLEKEKNKKQRGLDRITDRIVRESNVRMVDSYVNMQRELSTDIDHISAKIDIKNRETKVSADSIKFMKKLVEDAEKAVGKIKNIINGKELGSVEDIVISTIYDELESLKSYDIKKEILEAVVSPEQGGVVRMIYNYDEKRHYAELDAKLNYLRTARIIEALKSGSLSNNAFFNQRYLTRTP